MNLTLGKKIGGGFSLILLLTLVVSYIAIRAMNEGVTVSGYIATDRVPRLVEYSDLQNNLLLTGYNTRVFFENADENALRTGMEYLARLKGNIAQLEKYNAVLRFTNTANFLESFSREMSDYEAAINEGARLSREINELTARSIESAHVVLGRLESLIKTMSETQRQFLDNGDVRNVAQYSRNMADTASVYARVATVLERLLAAERNRDGKLLTEVRESLPGITSSAREVRGHLARQECRDLYDNASAAWKDFSELADHLAARQMELTKVLNERVRLYEDLFKQSEDMTALTTKNTMTTVTGAETTMSASTRLATILLGLVLALGVVLAVLITRMVVKPLAMTQVFAKAVAGGDLDKTLDVYSKDETGMLADDLRRMVVSLKQSITEARQRSEEAQKATEEAREAMTQAEEAARRAESAKREGMLAAAAQLEGVVEVISSASTELSAQIEQSDANARHASERLAEAATAMNEMNSTVREVARNAGATAQMSAETKEHAVNGANIVKQSLESTERVRKVSLELKEDMTELNRHAESISNIMNVISDIADQTNLLALNAAIEAARAGEAGRGFAVVADSVRQLAEKTMSSTSEVGKVVTAIQESTNRSVRVVEGAVEQIAQAADLAHQSGQALENIVTDADAAADQVSAIAAASEEQSAASEEINQSIEQVNAISGELAQAMGQASQAINDLATQAQNLSRLIEDMKHA